MTGRYRVVRPALVLLALAGAIALAGCSTTPSGTADTQTGQTVTPAPVPTAASLRPPASRPAG